MKNLDKIKRRINDEMFITAYKLLTDQIAIDGKTEELIEVSKELSKCIRSKAYMHAAKKYDKLGHEMESLLKLVIRINGEGVYG